MEMILKLLYKLLPKNIINAIGKSKLLKGVRDAFLRPNKKELIVKERITWGRGEFIFFAPLKIAVKAKSKGIENKLLRNSLKLIKDNNIKKPIILDIGANYGFVSLALQTNLDFNAEIYSFEPHPDIYNVLERSIEFNKIHNIRVENVAVGRENSLVDLNLFGQSSNVIESEWSTIRKVKIKQINLDTFLTKENISPNFIKIDVDGYELNVLIGLKETILSCKPIMVIETNDNEEILDFLRSCNYVLLDLDLNEFEGIPNNVFCISKS